MPVRRSLPLRTSDQVRRRNFGPGGLPARQILLVEVGVLPYAAGPSGILELGYVPAGLGLDNFGRFVCDSKETSAMRRPLLTASPSRSRVISL